MAVVFQNFLDEASAYFGEEVRPETRLWRDLRLWGDDFDLGFLEAMKERMPAFKGVTAPLHLFLPLEGEIGVFGKLVTSREIPDLTLRELFAFMEFGNSMPERDG